MRKTYLTFGAPSIDDNTIREVEATMRSGWIGTGPRVAEFEQRIKSYTGALHAAAVNSGTAALHLSLMVLGVGVGDEVITSPMTFCATANAIVHAGATPRFVDCDRTTGLIDPEKIEAAINERTRAIIPVHMAGRVADMNAILAIAKRHNLKVVEDAAHSLEGRYHGYKVGSMSDLTCFSFYVTKNITTSEGGMVTSNKPELIDELRVRALHGMSKDAWKRYSDSGYRHYQVVVPGFKYNMTDLEAAIGLGQFDHVEVWQWDRQRIWDRYMDAFRDLPVDLPLPEEPGTRHARHLFTLNIDEERSGISRDRFMQLMHERNIGTGVHFVGVHLQPWYRDKYGYQPSDFPNATWLSERTVSIPLSPHLTDEDVDDVIVAVRDILS